MEINSEEYEKHIKNEKKFYNPEIYREDLTEKENSGIKYLQHCMQEKIKQIVGQYVWDYMISSVNEKAEKNYPSPVKILSIGSGPGGAEMYMAEKFLSNYYFECIDINKEMLSLGQKKASSSGLKMKFIQQDVNQLSLPANTYDIVFAHASLHHIMDHEHVCTEIKKAMKNDSEFIVFDIIAKNGNQMWDETKKIANELWSDLPAKYRYDSTQSEDKKIIESLPDIDASDYGFECIRSQDLYPVLKQNFKTKIEVSGFSFARRFVESPFGENYDVENNSEDKLQLDKILELDEEYTKSLNLKPESVFLVLKK